jgi:hypothetical protein
MIQIRFVVAIVSAHLVALASTPNASSHVAFPPPSPELVARRQIPQKLAHFHPNVVLRDADLKPVVSSGGYVNFIATCGNCHDADWIGHHGYHFRVGLDEVTAIGHAPSGRSWDFGPGLFGRWDPLAGYDSIFLNPEHRGQEIDLWISKNRSRLVGGGPANLGDESRGYGPNCALCHVQGARVLPNKILPLAAYQTASLEPFGLFTLSIGANDSPLLQWNNEAFLPDGALAGSKLPIVRPSSEACGGCHGFAGRSEPSLSEFGTDARFTETTGQLFLASRMNESTLNLANRGTLGRPWDVHAERLVECVDCHFSPNDPSASFRTMVKESSHLNHEARRLTIGEYLRRPNHELAKGDSTQGHVANASDKTMRRCEDCHNARKVHQWLPKMDRHLDQIACETCHIGNIHAPSRRVTDYTVIDEVGQPRVEYRGLNGNLSDPATAISEYAPLYLRRKDESGKIKIFPYNIITSFYWVIDDEYGSRPASITFLKHALYGLSNAKKRLFETLDVNRDGLLDESERQLTTATSLTAIRGLLIEAGARNPRISAEMEPYGIHHGIAPARFALRDCSECHAPNSRLATAFTLAESSPFGAIPALLKDANVIAAFEINRNNHGKIQLYPNVSESGLYIFGLSRVSWLDTLGMLSLAFGFLVATIHGAMRFRSKRQRGQETQ